MQPYRDIGGDSGVAAYEIGDDFIHVQFTTGSVYEYTVASAGADKLEMMKGLAAAGDGLNGYINKYAKRLYSRRIR